MASLATAQAKWDRKMANAGSKWAANAQGKGNAMCQGVSEFIGQPAPGCNASGYDSGVQAVGATGFQSAVQGKGTKWANAYVNRMTGR
jgi:hypothetical protein